MAGISYFICDTETTGLKYDFHDLVEISIIRYQDRMQLTEKVKALNPNNASFDALQITGKTMQDLYTGMDCIDMVSKVNDFFDTDGLTPAHRCIVAHNAAFDMKFLHKAWERYGKQFPAELWLDTLSMSRKVAKNRGIIKDASGEKPKFNLYASCQLFGIKQMGGRHNAKDDTRHTYMLLKHFIDSGVDMLEHIKRIPHGDD